MAKDTARSSSRTNVRCALLLLVDVQFELPRADETNMSSFSSVQAEEALQQIRPPALAHREAHECASALMVGDVPACYRAFSEAVTWEDRWFCLEHMASQSVDRALVDAWVDGWPDHPLPLLVRAAIDAFGPGSAASDLDCITQIEPESPLGFGLQIVDLASRGSGDLEHPLGQMLAIEPLYEPHARYLRSLGPDAGGDIEAVIGFARSVNDVVPAGSPLRAMVPLAAVEVMVAERPADHLACLDGYDLRDAMMMAAGQSVFHPHFVGPPSIPGIKAMTAFVVGLMLLGEDALATKMQAFEQRRAEYFQFRESIDQRAESEYKVKITPILDQIKLIVERIGKEKGYGIVVDSAALAVLYIDSDYDLTNSVLAALARGDD